MVIHVELPDGNIAEFPDDTPHEVMKAAIAKKFPPMQAMGEITAPFQGFNKGVDAAINLPGSLLNLGIRGVNAGAEAMGYDRPLPDDPFGVSVATQANTGGTLNRMVTGNETTYQPQTTLGRYGETIGEVAGGSIIPEAGILYQAGRLAPAAVRTAAPIIERAAQAGPANTLKSGIVPTIGSGVGVQAARDMDLGPIGEIGGGIMGGFGTSAAYVPVARIGGGLKNAVRYGNETVRAARNPDEAAIRTTADSMVDARTAPSEIRSQLLTDANGNPLLSRELAGRGITEEHLADMISRRLGGESAEAIGSEYGISSDTVNNYATRFTRNTPTPMNIADMVTELRGPGGAMPVLRQGRAAFGIADDAADSAQALYNRQTEQSGRTADIIQKSGAPGRRLDDELERLRGTARQEERDAYGTVYQHDAPVQLDDVLQAARVRAHGRAGEIGQQLNSAIDMFFQPLAAPKRIAAMQDVRLQEMAERIARAEGAESPNQALIAQLRRRFDAMRDDVEYEQNNRPQVQTLGRPIQDVRRFVDARQELDQMIRRSMQDHQPTPLTQVLTEFRNNLNNAARANNPALTSADARFYGNRTAERIIERGQMLGKRLTPDTREAMREFRTMTPTQQELFRVAFEQRLADDALNTRTTGGAANQFSTQAFERLVNAFYPAPASALRGAERKAVQAVRTRGQELLRNLRREAITTGSGNFITGRGNSPTAVWANDIEGQMQNAHAAADLATGRVTKFMENMANRLAKQIGQQAASAQLRILTETDRPALLRLLNRLDQAAQGTAERKALVHQLRTLRTPKVIRPTTTIGIGVVPGL